VCHYCYLKLPDLWYFYCLHFTNRNWYILNEFVLLSRLLCCVIRIHRSLFVCEYIFWDFCLTLCHLEGLLFFSPNNVAIIRLQWVRYEFQFKFKTKVRKWMEIYRIGAVQTDRFVKLFISFEGNNFPPVSSLSHATRHTSIFLDVFTKFLHCEKRPVSGPPRSRTLSRNAICETFEM
jgi:hypothetical protein